jgi:fructosamine-3-kinase
MTFRKQDGRAPAGFFETEAAGLRWLAEAEGGAAVAEVIDVGPGFIELPEYPSGPATASAAADFGARLARTHSAGGAYHGAPPPGTTSGFIGPLPMPHLAEPDPSGWGGFYARTRLEPFARRAEASGALGTKAADDVRAVCERLCAGDENLTGPAVPAARLHGDLWSGNVLWTPDGVVLIDPAAHGGHPETDLAMLALFGIPHLDDVLTGYQCTSPLAPGWQERVGLHQLHPLLVHAALFGPSYGQRVAAVVRRYA